MQTVELTEGNTISQLLDRSCVRFALQSPRPKENQERQ
jgi:hypothetical protein